MITRPSLAMRSARFDRVVSVVASTEEHGPALALAARFGGAVLLGDGHLVAAYDARPDRARALAAAEAGRSPDAAEWAHWRAGTLRPNARLLGEMTTAGPLLVHSPALQSLVAGASCIPMPLDPLPQPGARDTISLHGNASACAIWALEQVRAWGLDLRLALPGPSAAARALADEIGVAPWVETASAPAELEVFLAMPGEASRGRALAAAFAAGRRCIASHWMLEALDAPPWAQPIADEPSPPLLAEAIVAAMARPAPSAETLAAFRGLHSPDAAAAALCAALGLGS